MEIAAGQEDVNESLLQLLREMSGCLTKLEAHLIAASPPAAEQTTDLTQTPDVDLSKSQAVHTVPEAVDHRSQEANDCRRIQPTDVHRPAIEADDGRANDTLPETDFYELDEEVARHKKEIVSDNYWHVQHAQKQMRIHSKFPSLVSSGWKYCWFIFQLYKSLLTVSDR
jgi:hypothetical protein